MNRIVAVAAASVLIVAMHAIGAGTPALAQSATGEAASGGIAGGDSFGSEGSARGGNGPSQTGVAASGGVAGGNPPDKSADETNASAAASGTAAGSVDVTATGSITNEDQDTEVSIGVETCGSPGDCE
jgi:hypothetical protein